VCSQQVLAYHPVRANYSYAHVCANPNGTVLHLHSLWPQVGWRGRFRERNPAGILADVSLETKNLSKGVEPPSLPFDDEP